MAESNIAMSRVLRREHEDVPNVGDIKTAPWALAPNVNVMSSGDPCQSISAAGRQQGRLDERFLWPWVRAAYREVRPDVLFFENVANIVSHDGGRTLAERFAHLREDGYEVRWCVLGACAVGAPHHRHRWYAVAARWAGPGPAPEARRVGGKKAICGAPRSGGRKLLPSPRTSDRFGAGLHGDGGPDLRTAVSLLPTPKATDGTNGGPNQRDGSGNFYLPRIVNLLPTPLATDVGTAGRRSSDGWRPQLGQAVLEAWGKYAPAIALWEQITGVPAPEPTEPGSKGGRRLDPALPEWMMGLRPGLLTDELSRSEALKGAGNDVVPQAVAAAWRVLTARA